METDVDNFTFLVGPTSHPFHVPRSLVARQSPVLSALVNGRMKESIQGRASWPDIQVDTFTRFMAFMYNGDYQEAQHETVPLPSPPLSPGHDRDHDRDHDNRNDTTTAARRSRAAAVAESQVVTAGLDFGSDSTRGDDDDDDDDDGDDDDDDDDDNLRWPSSDEEDGGGDQDGRVPGGAGRHRHPLSLLDEAGPYTSLPFDLQSYLDDDARRSEMLAYQGPLAAATYDLPALAQAARRFHAHGLRLQQQQHDDGMPDRLHLPERTGGLVGGSGDTLWLPRPNTRPEESYAPVLLSHADVYILADRYAVDPLRRLSLRRLHDTLLVMAVYPARVGDLVALTDALYDNTASGDEARDLVVDFWACFVEHLVDVDDLDLLLRRQADFAADLLRATVLRVRS